jgi:hypothetical protein
LDWPGKGGHQLHQVLANKRHRLLELATADIRALLGLPPG